MFNFIAGTGNRPIRLTKYETGEMVYINILRTARLYFNSINYRERTSILTRLIDNLYIDEESEVRYIKRIKMRVRSATTVVGIYNGSNTGRVHKIDGLGEEVIIIDDTPAINIIEEWKSYRPLRILAIDKAVTNLTHPSLLDSKLICSIDVVGLMVMYRNAMKEGSTPSSFLNKYVYTNMIEDIYKFSIINGFIFNLKLDNKTYAPYTTIQLSRYIKVVIGKLNNMVKKKHLLYGDVLNTIMLPSDTFNNLFKINNRIRRTTMYPYLLVWLPYVEVFLLDDRFKKHRDMNHNLYSELNVKLSLYVRNIGYFNGDERLLERAKGLLKIIKDKR